MTPPSGSAGLSSVVMWCPRRSPLAANIGKVAAPSPMPHKHLDHLVRGDGRHRVPGDGAFAVYPAGSTRKTHVVGASTAVRRTPCLYRERDD
jgi:hypothetical protein